MKNKILTTRINPQLEYEIGYIKSALGFKNTSLVMTQAVHSLYSTIKEEEAKKSPFDLLEELGLIGCIEGPSDLSTTYKKEVESFLADKFSSRKISKKVSKKQK